MNVAIIVAAGSGTRFGAGRAKQFQELAGVPIIVHTLRRFEQARMIDLIVCVVPSSDVESFLEVADKFKLKKPMRVVAGGATRMQSVWCGILNLEAGATQTVAVHDGVRPFVTPEEIDRVVNRATETGAAILASPAIDTIKVVEHGRITRTLERAKLWHAQTPQCFRYDVLRRAHEQSQIDSIEGTDDSALVERLGIAVSIIESTTRRNIKITTADDFAIAETMLKNPEFRIQNSE